LNQRVGDLVVNLDLNSARFNSDISAARSQLRGFGTDAASATNYLADMKSAALSVTGILAGGFTVGSIIKTADDWGQLSSRMAMATGSAQELIEAQRRLMEISDRTYKPIEEQSELFIRNASSMRELGYSTAETMDYIDSISSLLTINAASAQKAESAINALSKASLNGKVSGQNWHTVLETMPTITADLARHLGITETAVKQLAAAGKLSFKDFSEAIIAAREENARLADEMPNTVGDAITKLSNHWKAYIGEANAANGATATLVSGIGLLADNLDLVVEIGQALALGIGAKYLLTMADNARKAGKDILDLRSREVSLAASQLQTAQTTQYKATMARRLAEAEAVAALNTEKATAAAIAAAQARQREAVAINAVTAAQTRLNSVSSLASRAGSALVGVMGGLPGIIALGGAALYGLYQHQENTRKSAQEYGEKIDDIAAKIKDMELPETWDSEEKSRKALDEQNRLVAEQQSKVRDLQAEIEGLQHIIANPGPSIGGFLVNHLMSLDSATQQLENTTTQLAVEQRRLADEQGKAAQIQQVLSDLEFKRVSLIREEAAEQNKAYQSQLLMNGAYAAFNGVLSTGNNLLRDRSNIRAPLILPQNELNDAQQKALDAAARNKELAGLKGADRARRQAEFNADDLGLTGPENRVARQQLINDTVKATELQTELKESVKKTADPYGDIIKSQSRQLALYGTTTELAKTQYETTKGELAGLTASQKATVLRNATELDRLAAMERYKSLTEELRTPEENALAVARERVKVLKEANVSAEEYAEAMKRITKDMMIDAPKFSGIDASIGGAGGEMFKIAEAEKELQEWHAEQLAMWEEYYAEHEDMEQEHADRIAQINEQLSKRQEQIQYATTRAMITVYGDFTSGAMDLLSAMGQESSAIYKAMFIANKTAAVANAIVSAHVASAKALEMGPVMGIPMSKVLLGLGYANASLIASTALVGMAHDGIDNIPTDGTWFLQKGERVLDSRTNTDLKNYLSNASDEGTLSQPFVSYSPVFHINGDATERQLEQFKELASAEGERFYRRAVSEVMNGTGNMGNALKSKWNNGRKIG
jgi:tape measure domain-containing protein